LWAGYTERHMTTEYRALVAKVAAFADATSARRRDDITCSAGCSSCCHAWLTVSAVEANELRAALAALPDADRELVRARGLRELAREAAGDEPPRCAMLDDQGRCAVYEARPLVCRTQGHALRYPEGVIPAAAVARKMANGDVTWCPLNYHVAQPNPEDVLDAERVDQILAVVADRHVLAHGLSRHERHALSALAAEGDVLHEELARAHE
jgi:Fe-S-cluster containining protein